MDGPAFGPMAGQIDTDGERRGPGGAARRVALWTAAAAAAATGGGLTGSYLTGSNLTGGNTTGGNTTGTAWDATGVSIDSRTIEAGDLFVALAGPVHDGHDHVADALAKGAAAALVHRRPAGLADDAPLLHVEDTLVGLQALGRAARDRAAMTRVIGLTGSVGKTSTKELMRLALAAQAPTHASSASHNNHWGVPLSLARLPASSRYGVFEMGMNHAGEIRELTRQVRPHVALVTTVEAVHLEFFESVAGIADAKAEIFEGLEPDGIAVVNADNAYADQLADRARGAGVVRICRFGSGDGTEGRLIDVTVGADGTRFTADIAGHRIDTRLNLIGRHWALNAVGALLSLAAAGADVEAAAEAMASVDPLGGRGAQRSLDLKGGSLRLIDESYNASPVAVAAALQTLARTAPGPGGRRIAVLGDMRELGPTAADLHAGLKDAVETSADLLFTCGPLSAALHDAVDPVRRGAHAVDSATLAPEVVRALKPGDVVLVKGSLGSRMAAIVKALEITHTAVNGSTG